jgi:hypothetical protein
VGLLSGVRGFKANVQEAARAVWIAAGKTPRPEIDQSIRRYRAEQKDIEHAAREKDITSISIATPTRRISSIGFM